WALLMLAYRLRGGGDEDSLYVVRAWHPTQALPELDAGARGDAEATPGEVLDQWMDQVGPGGPPE
ncbi:MAG: hypothetical protein LWX11_08710, partial [Firmicutes bacterium]|nr:hypothetical protein [Bacillota bacterium]